MSENQLSYSINVGGNAVESIGNVKKALKEANAELINAQANFGDYSQEAITAAKRVAELKDKVSEARETADLFDPGKKFQAFAGAINAVAGGFAAVQGGLGLLGVESEEVEKSLLKVQSALALSQGLNVITDSAKDFKRLGAEIKSTTVFQAAYNFVMGEKVAVQKADAVTTNASTVATKAQAAATNTATVATTASSVALKVLRGAILATGIGALVIVLIAVVQNFGKIKTAILNAIPSLGKFASTVGNVINSFTDLIGVTNAASRAEQQRQAIFTKSSANTKIINEGIERQIKLIQAQGAESSKVDALRKQQINNELKDLNKLADATGKIRGAENVKKYKDLQNDLAVIDAAAQKQREDAAKQAAERSAATANKYGESQKKSAKELAKEKADAEKERADAELEALKQLADLRNQLFLSTFKDENERKKAELNIAFIQEKDQILANTKITEETRNQLIVAARLKLNSDLDAIAAAEKEKKDAADAKLLEDSAAQVTKDNEDEFAALSSKIKTLNKINEDGKEADAKIDKISAEQKIALAQQSAQALTALSDIVGKETAAGKALAVSAALINTYLGITAGVKLGFPAAIPAVAIAAATGFSAVKNIIATKVPGAATSGGAGNMTTPNISAAAPMAPPQPQAQTTTLDSQSINALGNQATRAYVVESDVTSSQERIAAIQQRARFG